MNKKILLIGGGIVLFGALFIGFRKLNSNTSAANRPSGRGMSDRATQLRIPVKGIILTPKPVDNKIFATGNILAAEEVELRSEVSGKVTAIRFKEGSHVRKGDLLVKINDSELRAQLQKTESKRQFLRDKEVRQKKLRSINAISEEQYAEGQNELTAISAEEQLTKAQIEKTEIRAPFDGVVGLRFISEGGYLTPAMVVARIQDIRSVKLDFSIPEKYAPMVEVGTTVTFTVEGSSLTNSGSVFAVEPKIDPVTRTLRLRALARNEKEVVLPGSFAKISLILSRVDNAVLIPSQAVIPDLAGQKVFLARNGAAVSAPIETGIRTEGMVHVLKGIAVNDTLITTGLLQLRDGSKITLTLQD
jgi:membrane fusion protein (multidrug efflux system)